MDPQRELQRDLAPDRGRGSHRSDHPRPLLDGRLHLSQAAARRRGPKVDRGRLGRARLRLEHGIPVTPAAAARASRARRWGPASSSTFVHAPRAGRGPGAAPRPDGAGRDPHARPARGCSHGLRLGPDPLLGRRSARSAGTSEPRRGRPHAASRRDQGPPAGAHGRAARRHRRDAGGGGRPNPPAAWTRTAGQLTEILPRRGAAVPFRAAAREQELVRLRPLGGLEPRRPGLLDRAALRSAPAALRLGGTLGVVTEATMRLVPKPQASAVALLYFASWHEAVDAVLEARRAGPRRSRRWTTPCSPSCGATVPICAT